MSWRGVPEPRASSRTPAPRGRPRVCAGGAPGPPSRRGHFGRLPLRFQRALEQDQAVAVRDGIGRGIPEPANLFRQGGDLGGAEGADRGERGGGGGGGGGPPAPPPAERALAA